jgi:hypothetical protein
MSHQCRLHHMPFPKLITMAEQGEILKHLAALKGCCPICVSMSFWSSSQAPVAIKI